MKKLIVALSATLLIGASALIVNVNATESSNSVQTEVVSNVESSSERCHSCGGTGRCGVCQGRGYFTAMGSGEKRACRTCGGSGQCRKCGGSGRTQ